MTNAHRLPSAHRNRGFCCPIPARATIRLMSAARLTRWHRGTRAAIVA